MLPFHLFSDPTIARSLLRYRWHNLPGAQEKARRNGWQGALFPWESARSGEEETPLFAAINIRTGLRQKSGLGAGGTSSGGRYRLGGYSILADHGGMKVSLRMKAWRYFWKLQSSGLAAR